MVHFVNEEAFFDWYERTSRDGGKPYQKDKVLDGLFRQFCSTREERFKLPAEQTVSGRDESFPFRFEDQGKCDSSALFIYF